MKGLKTLLLAGFLFLAFNQAARGQTNPGNKVLMVSPHVGEVIDAEERRKYQLFPADSAGFVVGRYMRSPENQIVLEIMLKNGKMEYRPVSQSEFELTGELIALRASAAKAATQQPAPPRPASAPSGPSIGKTTPTITVFAPNEKVYYVILNNQMSFFATVAERQEGAYVFNTQQFGQITATFGSIRYMKEVETQRNGENWIPNAHDSRTFFGPTGRGIPKGEGYFQVYYIYFAAANVGITDNFSIGAMSTIIPFVDIYDQFIFLTPKLSLKTSEMTSVSTGVLYTHFFSNDIFSPRDFGLLYSAGTYGTANKSVTAGIGYAFLEGEIIQKPVFMFNGILRVNNRVALMSENYILPVTETDNMGQDVQSSLAGGLYGLRLIWPKSNLDIAGGYIVLPKSQFSGFNDQRLISSYVLPVFISYSVRLGNRRNIGKL